MYKYTYKNLNTQTKKIIPPITKQLKKLLEVIPDRSDEIQKQNRKERKKKLPFPKSLVVLIKRAGLYPPKPKRQAPQQGLRTATT